MDETGYIPGDPLAVCDICGFRFHMSQTRKTWDGLRVCEKDYDPKHPQLTIRGIPDRQAVYDGRPEPKDVFVEFAAFGSFSLLSPNSTSYIVSMADGGTLTVTLGTIGASLLFLNIGNYLVVVDNSGNLSTVAATTKGPPSWRMNSPDNTAYVVSVPSGVITVGLAG